MKPLVTRKESTRYPGLFVRKYTKRVFFDNLWNQDPTLVESRGHVELADGTVVIRPFTKIFNRFENGMDIDRDENCICVEKINGFMAAVTWVDQVNAAVVSTTGSLDSDYVKLAEKHLESAKQYVEDIKLPITFLFEIVDQSDPHIISENVGAYLIGMRKVVTSIPYFTTAFDQECLDDIAENYMNVRRPHWFNCKFSTVVELIKAYDGEGFVVYGQDSFKVLKMKSPYYLTLKAAARRKDIFSLNKQNVDEEFYPLIEHLTSLGDAFTMLDEQNRLKYMRNWLGVK